MPDSIEQRLIRLEEKVDGVITTVADIRVSVAGREGEAKGQRRVWATLQSLAAGLTGAAAAHFWK